MQSLIPISLAILLLYPGYSNAIEPIEIFARSRNSLGSVHTTTSYGSGVVIDRETVVTNCHVIEESQFSPIQFKNQGKLYAASLIKGNASLDLCVLRVVGLAAPQVKIRRSSGLKEGERVYAIGNLLGLELTISEGLISGLRSIEESIQIQTSAAISSGSSGGGLFDVNGRLIGITTSSLVDGQAINFAQPADLVHSLPVIAALKRYEGESPKVTPQFLDTVIEMQERLDYVELGKVSLGWMKFDPNSTFAITLAGWSLLNIGKPADGRQILAKALEKSPSFTVASYALAYASKGSERHQILKACADVIDPPNSLVGAFKGLCMSELGDSNAPKEVDAWLSESLHKSWLLTIKALIHKNLNNFSLSLQYAEQAIIENKNSSWARLVGSHSALMANHADKASRLAVDGIRISPQHQGLLEIAVAANFAASKPTEALAYFAQLQNLYPQRAGQLKGKLERVGIKF